MGEVVKGGRLVGPANLLSLKSLASMKVPGKIILEYGDVECTTMFDRTSAGAKNVIKLQSRTDPNMALQTCGVYCKICCKTSVSATRKFVLPACCTAINL